ncbi:MAG: T9SS type A sorting domain-containing protein [Bacteroidia bacterium]
MTIKNYAAAFLVFSSLVLSASEGGIISNANKNDVRFIKDPKRKPDVAFQQSLRQGAEWQNFMSANGTWYVIFNEENAKPHRAFGKPIAVFGMDPQSRAMNFISGKLADFHIPVSELILASNANSQQFQYVHFRQVHSGLKVLNSDVYVKMTAAGKVISFGCDVFNDISVSTTPVISSSDAITFAQGGIVDPVTSTSVNSELFILPVPEYKKNIYHLVYEVYIETKDASGVPARYYTLVDAENGQILYRENKVKHFTPKPSPPPAASTDIYITGTVYPTNPYDPSAVMPLRNLKMTSASVNYNTDSLGYIGLPSSSPVSVTFSLEGFWSKVFTGGVTPSFTATANPGTNNFSFTAANIRELSAYYHVNIVHDYMKTKFPAFTGMDSPLPTNIDLTSGTCNAFYSGTSINFYALGGGCNSMAQIGDVIYHEYGHGINHTFYTSVGGSFDNGGMDEGYADTWALGITGSAILGIGMDVADPTVYVRRYDINKKVYPQDLVGEVHADGEIIAGCWYDTGLNFGDRQMMMDLYKETFYAAVTGPNGTEGQVYTDVLIEALTDDDVPANGGDNDITNGTPNDNAIVDAFDIHGITLLSNAVITHTAILSSTGGAAIPVNAMVSVTYPWALTSVKMFYKLNRLGVWNGVAMTNTSGINYTASIPAQPNGTVIAYYLGLEGTTGTLSLVKPVAADETSPNLPYYILNGVSLMAQEDFDANFGAWGQGVPSDNATTGLWVVDAPTPSYGTFGTPSTIVQPDVQNTPGGVMCAVTGNAPNASDGLGTNDVDGGITTLESPVYNLSSYTNPVFTYYRWFSNNSGANPNTDYWQVQISNDGGTSWTDIEHTLVSDKSWRRNAIRVKDYTTLSSQVLMRFMASDSLIPGAYLNGGSLVEGAVDDFFLYEEAATGVNDQENITSIGVYPNPAHSVVNVSYQMENTENVTLIITNNVGQIVYSESVNDSSLGKHSLAIDTDQLAAGLYLLNVRAGKRDHVQKFSVIR